MIDRDELIRFRIDNYLDRRLRRLKKVEAGLGTIVARGITRGSVTLGVFAQTRKEFKSGDANYFLETPLEGGRLHRQLWLPALRWVDFGTVRQREIVATEAPQAERFAAWQDVQPEISDLEDYSEYDSAGQALFDEAEQTLRSIGANNTSFGFRIRGQ